MKGINNKRDLTLQEYRASSKDYAIFYTQLESALDSTFEDLYHLLHTTAKLFPEILRFFVTENTSIPLGAGIKSTVSDLEYIRRLKKDNPKIEQICAYVLGIQYKIVDVGFFSQEDQARAEEYKKENFHIHRNFPENRWYGFPMSDSYNLSEAIRLFEITISGGSFYFVRKDRLLEGLKSGAINTGYVWIYLCACLNLGFLNIKPSNIREFAGYGGFECFEDIVLDSLQVIDQVLPGTSSSIVLNGVPLGIHAIRGKVRREVQNYNIQGSCLEESNPYTFFLGFHTVNSALQKLRKLLNTFALILMLLKPVNYLGGMGIL